MFLEIQREFFSANWQYWINLRRISTASVFCFRFRRYGGCLGEGKIILEVHRWKKKCTDKSWYDMLFLHIQGVSGYSCCFLCKLFV